MKRLIMATAAVLLLGGGIGIAQEDNAEKQSTHLAGHQNKAPGAPGYQQIGDDDKQFARAAEHAQRSLGFFMAALKA
jgi:Trm5-related predicted tRNA methylase